jgi:hypothetical protein
MSTDQERPLKSIRARAYPLHGQKHRCSENFGWEYPSGTAKLRWEIELDSVELQTYYPIEIGLRADEGVVGDKWIHRRIQLSPFNENPPTTNQPTENENIYLAYMDPDNNGHPGSVADKQGYWFTVHFYAI